MAAAERMHRIDPHIRISAHPDNITRENASELLSGCDVVLDALDSVSSRRTLSEVCDSLWIPLIHGAVSG